MAAYRGTFRTLWNIYKGAFFAKIINSFKLLTIFEKRLRRRCSTRLKIGVWLRVLNIELTLVPSRKLSRENTQPENMCDIVFEKTKSRGGTVNRASRGSSRLKDSSKKEF